MPKKTYFNLPEAKRQIIEAVAIDEFAAVPFASASISAIVARAGIAKGSFYQYFEDKKDLYLHLLDLSMKQKVALVSQFKPSERALDMFDYLRWMLQVSVLFEMRYPKLAKIAYRALVEDVPFADEAEKLAHRGGMFYFNDFLAQGILHDDVATWVDTDMAAFLLGAVYNQFGRYLLKRTSLSIEDFADGKLDIFKDQVVQDLFDNLMDIIMAGIARDPEIRNQYFNK